MPDLPVHDTLSVVDRLNVDAASLGWTERLRLGCAAAEGRVVFTTSFGVEDQVIVHLLAQGGLLLGGTGVEVATLDTGRLFPETLALWAATERRYGVRVRAMVPRRD